MEESVILILLKTAAAMLPEKLCHAEKMAPGTAARGNMAKCVAASDVARPEFCMPTSMEMAVRLSYGNPHNLPAV